MNFCVGSSSVDKFDEIAVEEEEEDEEEGEKEQDEGKGEEEEEAPWKWSLVEVSVLFGGSCAVSVASLLFSSLCPLLLLLLLLLLFSFVGLMIF